MTTPEEVKAAPGGIYGPIDFGGWPATVSWIKNHHHGEQDLDIMFDWFQVADESQEYGLIAVDMGGLIFGFPPGDPSPFGKPVASMDEAIREMRP
jgi:hypothetical protein